MNHSLLNNTRVRSLVPALEHRRRLRATLLAAAMSLAALPASLDAVQPGRWVHSSEADFSTGKSEGVVVTNLGDVKLSAGTLTIGQLPEQATVVYSVVQVPNGDIYMAVGPEARLLRRRGQQIEEVLTATGQQIFTLSFDNQGRLLVALSGNNKSTLAVLENDKLRTLAELPDVRYVWDMVVDGKTAYLATGTQGKLLKVALDGDHAVETLLDIRQNNLLCIGKDQAGRLYVGTDTEGLIYRVTPKPEGQSEVFVLFDAPEPEVGSLLVMPDGTVFAGTADAEQAKPGRLSEAASDNGRVQPNAEGAAGEGKPPAPGNAPGGNPGSNPASTPEGSDKAPATSPATTPKALTPEDAKDPAQAKPAAQNTSPGDPIRSLIAAALVDSGSSDEGQSLREETPALRQLEQNTIGETPAGSTSPTTPTEPPPTPEQHDKLREVIRQRLEQARKTGQLQAEPSRPGASRRLRVSPGKPGGPASPRPSMGSSEASKGGNAVYRIDPTGPVQEVFRENVMILKLLEDHGKLLVATGNEGLIYRVDPQAEETTVLGNIEPQQVPAMAFIRGQVALPPPANAASQPATQPASGPATPPAAGTKSAATQPVSATTKPSAKPTASVGKDVREQRLGSDRKRSATGSATRSPATQPGSTPSLTPAELASMAEVAGQEYILLGTANPASLVRMDRGFARRGTFTSTVLDASQISLWGKLGIVFDAPQGTSVTLETRSGNVRDPDQAAWSDWSEPLELKPAADVAPLSPMPVTISSPPARFFQYRLTLRGTGTATPVVDRVEMAFVTPNIKPAITSIKATYPNQSTGPTPPGKPGSSSRDTSDNDDAPPTGLNIEWEASDPNGDRLRYTLEYRPAGSEKWLPLAENIEKNSYEWETRRVPDGRYLLRVKASDETDNPLGMARSTTRQSDPVAIDNTPPELENIKTTIEGKGKKAKITLKFTAKDALLPIKAVGFAVDQTKKWEAALPDDLIFDSTDEAITITISDLSTGPHVVSVRASDQRGNTRHRSILIDVP